MTHHFGVLVPSNNTTIETELSRLPASYQAHYARVLTGASGQPFATSKDEDVDYQSRLLATAKVEMVVLVQTTASLVFDDYDAVNMRRIESAGGEALQSSNSAKTLRFQVGKVIVTDGPYAETKEQIGGILILEARDIDHAVELMSKPPGVSVGPFEIRPAADLTEMVRESEQRRARRKG